MLMLAVGINASIYRLATYLSIQNYHVKIPVQRVLLFFVYGSR